MYYTYVCKYVCIKYRIISVIKLLQRYSHTLTMKTRYSHTLTMKTFNQQPFSRYSIFCDVNYINVCMYVRMYVSVYLYDTVMQCVVSNSVHVYVICTYVRKLILSLLPLQVSKACMSICQWVRAMHKYHFVAKNVAPKRVSYIQYRICTLLHSAVHHRPSLQRRRNHWRRH